MQMLDTDAGVDDPGNLDATVTGVGYDDPAVGESVKTRLNALEGDVDADASESVLIIALSALHKCGEGFVGAVRLELVVHSEPAVAVVLVALEHAMLGHLLGLECLCVQQGEHVCVCHGGQLLW